MAWRNRTGRREKPARYGPLVMRISSGAAVAPWVCHTELLPPDAAALQSIAPLSRRSAVPAICIRLRTHGQAPGRC